MDKSLPFNDLWAVILGGSSGFGYAAVEKLVSHGMNVALLYRETSYTEKPLLKKLTALANSAGVKILPYNINALDAAGRDVFIEKITPIIDKGSVKLLLHSIARGNLKPLFAGGSGSELSTDDIRLTSYAMANSLLDWTRLLIEKQLFMADARIIGLTSEGAHKYWDSYAAIAIAKSSLESLAKYMAVEFSPLGLKTNIIQAGVTITPALKMIPGSEKLIEAGIARNPMGRLTTPKDVADVIYLLCRDEAFWINGALIHVDGGEHCK